MAAKYGVELRRTLTGFKFIGEQIGLLEAAGEADRYIFGLSLIHIFLSTAYGNVLVYGVIDELMPASIHDIKTTGSYTVGKYRYQRCTHLCQCFRSILFEQISERMGP